MYPTLLEWGTWRIRSYDVVLILAIITCMVLAWRELVKEGYPKFKLVVLLVGTIFFAILGARINGWYFWWKENPGMLNLNVFATSAGMTSYGGYLGALGFTTLFSYFNRWNIWKLLDVIIPLFALGEGIQRVGCFLHGCCFGKETEGIAGFYLPDNLQYWAYRYPSQIITGIFCFILFTWLWQKREYKTFDGVILLYYLVFYNIGRLMLDFLRGDQPMALGLLSAHQLSATIVVIISGLVLYVKLESNKEGQSI